MILPFLCLQSKAQTSTEILIQHIAAKVKDSKLIIDNEHAKEVLSYGLRAIPDLVEIFDKKKKTKVYSICLKRYLTVGEIAIILADTIKRMPYYTLTGIQNCTLEYCEDNPNLIEYYLGGIKLEGVEAFKKKYLIWFYDN